MLHTYTNEVEVWHLVLPERVDEIEVRHLVQEEGAVGAAGDEQVQVLAERSTRHLPPTSAVQADTLSGFVLAKVILLQAVGDALTLSDLHLGRRLPLLV